MIVHIGGSGKFTCAKCSALLPITSTDDGQKRLSHPMADYKFCQFAGKQFQLPAVDVEEIVQPVTVKAGGKK